MKRLPGYIFAAPPGRTLGGQLLAAGVAWLAIGGLLGSIAPWASAAGSTTATAAEPPPVPPDKAATAPASTGEETPAISQAPSAGTKVGKITIDWPANDPVNPRIGDIRPEVRRDLDLRLIAIQRKIAADQAELNQLREERAAQLDRQSPPPAETRSESPPSGPDSTAQIEELILVKTPREYKGVVVDPSELDAKPVPIFQVPPRFPAQLRKLGMGGEALIEFIVDPNGDAAEVRAVQATHEQFGRAAVEAVRNWKFTPARKGERDVATRVHVPVVFSIAQSEPEPRPAPR